MRGRLLAVAPQLHSLAVEVQTIYISAPFYPPSAALDAILVALRDVRHLRLGLHGYTLPTIFSLLQRLDHLSSLSITDPELSICWDGYGGITRTAVDDFLLRSHSIRHLTLPEQLELLWPVEEKEKVQKTAHEQGVGLNVA